MCNTVKASWALRLYSRNAQVRKRGSIGMIYFSFLAFPFNQSSQIQSSKSNKVKSILVPQELLIPLCTYVYIYADYIMGFAPEILCQVRAQCLSRSSFTFLAVGATSTASNSMIKSSVILESNEIH